ncbi:hypothetical protein OSB04_un001434 [Centaurea solstitialis]|uniref:ATP-dependent Clp protease proteolytic subunit n=1 Tax=Centaurea solstitialis TaxID=347529 RepID=A0AA38W1Q2_9ASTR|nr:hypothetical protein OSB04_un001434 [Centaurea solstitialis]
MHGSSRFHGIFDPGRGRNYQTSSIPSRLAPMRLLFERKKKTMPSPVMIHQPAGSFSEVATGEFILEVGELLKLRETLTRVYVQRTGKPFWVVSEDMERDVFMSATEAQAYGIVDLVAVE